MRVPVRLAGAALTLLLTAGFSSSALEQKQIDAAVAKGVAYLKARYATVQAVNQGMDGGTGYGIGPAALSGLAILEGGTPGNDPSVQAIATVVRDTSYREYKTYQVVLCILFLDRLGDPADDPIIQMLTVRLLAGQNDKGGWGYNTVPMVNQQDEQRLRAALKNNQLVAGGGNPGGEQPKPLTKMHPEVEKYYVAMWGARNQGDPGNDNSNTQFGILGVWIGRRHGIAAQCEAALQKVDERFLATQNPQDGGWAYAGLAGGQMASTPTMTCAGLLGLATGIARREERRRPEAPPTKQPLPKDAKDKGDDPFFNPPPKAGGGGKKADPGRPMDARDAAAARALAGLGGYFAAAFKQGGVLNIDGKHGDRDLYFWWSIERVGVVYGVEEIGGMKWYDVGAEVILRAQSNDGSWGSGSGYGPEANTSFAVLFLLRSNIVQDMSNRVSRDNALSSGGGNPNAIAIKSPAAGGSKSPEIDPGVPGLPVAVEDASVKMGNELLKASAEDRSKVLAKLRDTKGGDNTKALVFAIHRLDADHKKEAREALAERLTRMNAETLRAMMKSDDPELRRAATLACAMKDDKDHIADLIERLGDDEELVVRAARAGLKSLTGEDFGPENGATPDKRKAAADAWKSWLAKQKK